MCTDMKGCYSGLKCLSQIFVVKERDLEIGYPTDVKHVAHIGGDGNSSAAPSWMNGFKTEPDFSATSITSSKEKRAPISKGFNQSTCKVDSTTAQKKHGRKKPKSTVSSPKTTSETSRSNGMQQILNV